VALMPVAEARARVLDGAVSLPAEYIPVAAAHGRVLASDLAARRTQPPAAVSAMDGYAVRASDVAAVPVTLKLIGDSAAGSVFDGEVHPGETVRILTGGVLPAGADTIVIQENVRRDGDAVVVQQAERSGRFVRPAGLDF
jgi:molybdopterin molybdotransferase